jgi:hypothetical protein
VTPSSGRQAADDKAGPAGRIRTIGQYGPAAGHGHPIGVSPSEGPFPEVSNETARRQVAGSGFLPEFAVDTVNAVAHIRSSAASG